LLAEPGIRPSWSISASTLIGPPEAFGAMIVAEPQVEEGDRGAKVESCSDLPHGTLAPGRGFLWKRRLLLTEEIEDASISI